jgi:hypothetical protein
MSFAILLQIGAGTGLIFILRWFWWRINAYSEITGMVVSFVMALFFEFTNFGLEDYEKLVYGVAITTLSWITVTLLTRPTKTETLSNFYNAVTPYGNGWKPFKRIASEKNITLKETHDVFTIDLASMLLGILFVYSALFATGYVIYGNTMGALVLIGVTIISGFLIFKLWKKKKKPLQN